MDRKHTDGTERITNEESPEYRSFIKDAAERLKDNPQSIADDKLTRASDEFENFRREQLLFASTKPDPDQQATHQTYHDIQAIRDRRVGELIGDRQQEIAELERQLNDGDRMKRGR